MAGISYTAPLGWADMIVWVDPLILNADAPPAEPHRASIPTPTPPSSYSTTPRASPRVSSNNTRALQKRAAQIALVTPPAQKPQIDLDAPHWDRASMRYCLAGPQSETWQDFVHRELDDTRRRTIPILNPHFLSHLEPKRLAQLIQETIIRIRTMVAPGNEHLLKGDTTAFERVSWMMAPEVVPLLMGEAARLQALHPNRYPIQLRDMLNEYSRHKIDLCYQMAMIRNELKLQK